MGPGEASGDKFFIVSLLPPLWWSHSFSDFFCFVFVTSRKHPGAIKCHSIFLHRNWGTNSVEYYYGAFFSNYTVNLRAKRVIIPFHSREKQTSPCRTQTWQRWRWAGPKNGTACWLNMLIKCIWVQTWRQEPPLSCVFLSRALAVAYRVRVFILHSASESHSSIFLSRLCMCARGWESFCAHAYDSACKLC